MRPEREATTQTQSSVKEHSDAVLAVVPTKNTVNIETRLWVGRPGFDSRQGWVFSLRHPVQIDSDSPSLLSNGYQGIFPQKQTGLPRLRMRGAIIPLPHTSSWCGA
jgi:hypothetical protein